MKRFRLPSGKTVQIANADIRFMRKPGIEMTDHAKESFFTDEYAVVHFELKNRQNYYFEFYKAGGLWRSNGAGHGDECFKCRFCGRHLELFCEAFSEREGEFASHLLSHPNVRLQASLRLKPRGF